MFAALALIAMMAGPAQAAPGCELGAWRSAQGDIAAFTPPLPDTTALRYTMLDGRRGSLGDPDAPVSCDGGAILGPDHVAWTHLQFRATPAKFRSGDVELNGLLLEPPSSGRKPPLVVLVHGSEKTSPIGLYYQELFTAQGVATFAYDKRGTAGSQGTYTQDFKLLAQDAANAAAEARRLAAGRFGRIGFFGGSQGGWVAPLAAAEAKVDFLEVGFGVVGTALEQDQWQVDYQLIRQKGQGSEILPKVHEVTDATAEVMAQDFSPASLDRIEALRKQYGAEPWFAQVEGQYSGELLKGQAKQAEWESPGVPWRYSSLEAVRRLNIPQLWVFAAEDSIAPSAPSIARLQQARGEGRRIDIAVFPRTDHGIRLFTTEPGGERKYSGAMAPGYLKLLADFAKGELAPPYGEEAWPDRASRKP